MVNGNYANPIAWVNELVLNHNFHSKAPMFTIPVTVKAYENQNRKTGYFRNLIRKRYIWKLCKRFAIDCILFSLDYDRFYRCSLKSFQWIGISTPCLPNKRDPSLSTVYREVMYWRCCVVYESFTACMWHSGVAKTWSISCDDRPRALGQVLMVR